jgi:translation initiation factor 2 subunit 1
MPKWPGQDELVLATVKKIMPYGAFCTLDEYGNTEAFIHISEVAPRWIKNIHEFLHENQHIVARVFHLVPEKNQIDLSLKRVTEAERKLKLESVKREKRAEKLFEMAVKEAKSTTHEAAVAREKLLEKFGDLLEAFETASDAGEEALSGLAIEKGLAKAIISVCKRAIKKPKAKVEAMLLLTSYAKDGITAIKAALLAAKPPADAEVALSYIGAPRYHLSIIAPDYKRAEKVREEIVAKITAEGKARDVQVMLETDEKK